MNNTLILYKSKTGFTKKYAEQIAQKTGGTPMDFKAAAPELLSTFDRILFGSRMHAGRIDGLEDARKLLQKSHASLSALFVTGAMPNTEEQTITEMWKNNLTPEEMSELPHFYLPGGLCYEKMNLSDKAMMKMFVFMMKHKKDKTPEEKRLAEIITHSYDISSEDFLRPLVEYLTDNAKCHPSSHPTL